MLRSRINAGFCFSFLIFPIASAFCQSPPRVSFVPAKTPIAIAGSAPHSVAVGDFDGDGKLDLAVANAGDNNVSILLGKGDGTFQQAVNYPVGSGPYSVAVGDFDGDGNLDLAVANFGGNTVSVLLADPNKKGAFLPAVAYAVGSGPLSVAVDDFDGDGNLDLAVANQGDDTVSVLLGDPNKKGAFLPAAAYPVGHGPQSVAVGKFGVNGKPGLAVAAWGRGASGIVSVLLPDPNKKGAFLPAVDYATDMVGESVAVGDFNRDGKPDLAVGTHNMLSVSVLLGKAGGTFGQPTDYIVGHFPTSLAVGDFNGDGKPDLVAAIFGGTDVGVLVGNGDGTFLPAVYFGAGAGQQSVAVGDFNGDGKPDLAVANSGGVSVLLNTTPNHLTVSPAKLTFALQLVGTTSRSQTATLTATGMGAVNITSIAATGDFSLKTNTCGISVAAGTSCTISVLFNPTLKDSRSGAITITDDAADSPQTVSLQGTGTVVSLTPAGLRFAGQEVGTTSPPQKVTLKHVGTAPLNISRIAITGTNAGDFTETNDCRKKFVRPVGPAGSGCTITVTFKPTAAGRRGAQVSVSDNGGGSPQTVFLLGGGIR